MLKMDRDISSKDKMKRVEEIMSQLNLKKCENTKIGFADKDIKGISGGERRRLAFACEVYFQLIFQALRFNEFVYLDN
jgi:ABC-type multidrug transport system ATPase subunit